MIAMGIIQHNPGNLRANDTPWQGLDTPAAANGFFRFTDPVMGLRAMARTLIYYQDRLGKRTITDIVSTYAPPEDHNDTPAYIEAVAKFTERGSKEMLDLHRYEDLCPLMKGMVRIEVGAHPYTDAQFDKACILAGVAPPEVPVSKTGTVKGAQVATAATTIGIGAEVAQQIAPLSPLVEYIQWGKYVLAAVVLVAIGFIVWRRIDDRRMGLR